MHKAISRTRMSAKDALYGGELVDGAHLLHLLGDIAAEFLIRHDGDEGRFVGYADVCFLASVFAGDYIEAEGEIIAFGKTSRKMEFTARKVIVSRNDIMIPPPTWLKNPLPSVLPSAPVQPPSKNNAAD